ncbi:MAG: linear amide C-N hydrolase, partial [Bacteroidetes bacterium]|nr:linear amide C-N hydrolase [Bacteroidota bacterium]
MKKMFTAVIFILIADAVIACTTFSFSDKKGNIVFGRNYDFPVGVGHIHINKRNMRKIAFIRPPEKPLEWISKYGSITFNQIGKEFPYGGMNEAGLVIEQMWLQETVYPQLDERYGLSELQWIQYQLDNSKSVKDVIASDSLVRISFTSVSPLHFLVSDVEGNVATIEYLDGKMTVHRDNNLPYPVLANCSYEHSSDYKASIDKKENRQFNDWTLNSSGRFAKA